MKTILSSMCMAAFLVSAGCEQEIGPLIPSPSLRAPVIESLTPQALEILKTAMKDTNSYLRTPAVEIAAETDQRQFLPKIIQMTEDPVVPVRFAAVVALGDMQCRSCRPILQKKLDDPNPNVRIAAAYGLVKIGAAEYRQRILQTLDSRNPTVAANVVLLLGKLGNREDLQIFYQLMHDNNMADKVRFQALESIARLKDTEVYRNKIWPLLISKYHDDRVWGIRCMGALGTPEARTAIQTMLQDDVLEVRLAAAEQLGFLQDHSGSRLVLDYLETANLDETTMANQMAVSAIGRIGEPSLNAHLPRALSSRSPLIRLIAAQSVLIQRKNPPESP